MDNKPTETPREIARGVFLCITEIDDRFREFTTEFDAGFKEQRNVLELAIIRAERKGADFTAANARKELTKLNRTYHRRRRAKFKYLLTSVCKKHGRNLEHIVRVAGYNYRQKSIRTS
jgi:hypothetical protein